jgi:hypothetical protein
MRFDNRLNPRLFRFATARQRVQETFFMDNREYPRSVMPDVLCCWVFHVPPTLDYA